MVRNPAILMLMKSAGLDFARVDMEHAMPGAETIADFALVSRTLNFPIIVRPPSNSREWIQRLLDAGVWGLQCAGVKSVHEAREIASLTHYWPMGDRGMGVSTPATEFELKASVTERMSFMNKQVFITIMLESERAFEDLDEIASLQGIDCLTLGPTDLAQDMHVYGTPDERRVIAEKRKELIAAAKRHRKTTAFLVSDAEQARELAEAGAAMLAFKSDTNILFDGYSKVAELKSLRPG
jgi:2-keto-3-deoxy-L-rhamnonate aldolase RhmA